MQTVVMHARRLAPFLALTLLGGAALSACEPPYRFGGVCGEIGCADGFRVDFEHDGEWQAGTYRVEVDLDGETTICEATLPLDCDAPSPCGDEAPVLLELEGCALDPGEQSLGGVAMAEGPTPETVAVRVFLDDTSVGEASFEPDFVQTFPNGGSCPPICDEADPDSMPVD